MNLNTQSLLMNGSIGAGNGGGLGNGGGSEGNAYTFQNLISKLSITGNIMVDSWIIMNLFTWAKALGESSFKVLSTIAVAVVSWLCYYISSIVKSKFTGRVVFRSFVDEDNPLYKTMFNNIIDANLDGDVKEDWKFKWLKVESSFSGSYFDDSRKKEWESRYPVKLGIDYTSPKGYQLNFAQNYGTSDRKLLIFKHTVANGRKKFKHSFFDVSRTFYIKTEWTQLETTQQYFETDDIGHHSKAKPVVEKTRNITFDLIIFDVPSTDISKQIYFDIFYDFLQSRFKALFDNMIFSYTFNYVSATSDEVYQYLYRTSTRSQSYRNANQGWLAYGDDNIDIVKDIINSASTLSYDYKVNDKDKHLPSKNIITFQSRPASLDFDCEKNINIITDFNDNLSVHDGSDIFSNFLRVAGVKRSASGSYGFFQFKEKGIAIQLGSIIFLKKGSQITESEVYEVLQHMIERNLQFDLHIKKSVESAKTQMNVMKWNSETNSWTATVLSKRCFETIYLPRKFKEEIIKEFDNFVRTEKFYRKVEVPYRKGIMLYGPPGTGKTSLVRAVSYEYQMPLYILDVNAEDVNDDTIVSIMNSLGGAGLKILLFEDIDAAFADKEKMLNEDKSIMSRAHPQYPTSTKDSKGVANDQQQMVVEKKRKFLTYSGLLNAFDGVMSNQTGVITILTTNHIEKLGDAFIRAGRVDAKFELKECNQEQIETMVMSFIKKSVELFNSASNECLGDDEVKEVDENQLKKQISEFAAKLVDEKDCSLLKPCDIQSYLLKHIGHYNDIFTHVDELINVNKK